MSWSVSVSNQQTGDAAASAIETTVVTDNAVNEAAPIGFFAIGIAINLVLLCAYFIWAYRQWKKPETRDNS
jgi:hypothetical protein